MTKIVCEYCRTLNPSGEQECTACGAPLEIRPPQTSHLPAAARPKPQADDAYNRVMQAADRVGKTADKAMYVYAVAWRTVGEATAIALVGFSLGLIGMAANAPALGLLGAAAVGVVVGLAVKNFWLTILLPPLGLLLGIVAWLPLWALGAPPGGMIVTGALAAVLGGWAGQYRWAAERQRGCWDKVRPFLGALGGIAFALLGAALAWLIRQGASALIGS